jgi:hypothetical protein
MKFYSNLLSCWPIFERTKIRWIATPLHAFSVNLPVSLSRLWKTDISQRFPEALQEALKRK